MINYTFQKKPLPQQIQIWKIFAKTKFCKFPFKTCNLLPCVLGFPKRSMYFWRSKKWWRYLWFIPKNLLFKSPVSIYISLFRSKSIMQGTILKEFLFFQAQMFLTVSSILQSKLWKAFVENYYFWFPLETWSFPLCLRCSGSYCVGIHTTFYFFNGDRIKSWH